MAAIDPLSISGPLTIRRVRRIGLVGFYLRHERALLGTLGLTVVLAIWQAAWTAGLISPMFFSGPSAVVVRLWAEAQSGRLLAEAMFTWKNFFIGFFLALVFAVPVGICIAWYRRLGMMVEPLLNTFYAVPRIAFYPLIIIWFGLEEGSKIFVIFLSAVMPILVNTIAGVRNIDRDLIRAARAFCGTDRQIFAAVVLPGSVPFILAGVRQGVAHGLIGAVIAEMLAGSRGLGFLIGYAGQTFATDLLLVGVICVAASGLALNAIADNIHRRFDRWRPPQGN
jgi:NitT/TauT family transport system permease protein